MFIYMSSNLGYIIIRYFPVPVFKCGRLHYLNMPNPFVRRIERSWKYDQLKPINRWIHCCDWYDLHIERCYGHDVSQQRVRRFIFNPKLWSCVRGNDAVVVQQWFHRANHRQPNKHFLRHVVLGSIRCRTAEYKFRFDPDLYTNSVQSVHEQRRSDRESVR